jgi:hypothetical protein
VSLLDLLRHNAKDRKYLGHDLYDDALHSRRRPDVKVYFKAAEKGFYAAKQV